MRVIHSVGFCQPKLGYEEFYLPLYQKRAGAEAIVVTSNRYSAEAGQFQNLADAARVEFPMGWDDSEQFEVPIFRLPLLASAHGQTLLRGLGRTLQRLRPDLVHCHDVTSPLALQVAMASRRLGFPVVYDSHALYDAFRTDNLATRAYLAVHRILIKRQVQEAARVIIALSGETERILTQELGFPQALIVRSTLGVDTELFRPDPILRQSSRGELGLGDDDRVIVYTGKIAPWKRVDLLLEAFSRLDESRERNHLILVGSADLSYKAALSFRAAELGLADRIVWTGAVPHASLPKFYNAAEVCVWPGQSSLAMLEAAACGVPVVVHDRPVNLERISRANGVAFDGTSEGLASVLQRLLSDPVERRTMGENARKLAEEELDWRKVAARTLTIYERVLESQ